MTLSFPGSPGTSIELKDVISMATLHLKYESPFVISLVKFTSLEDSLCAVECLYQEATWEAE